MTPDAATSFYPHSVFGRFSARVRRVAGLWPGRAHQDLLLALGFMLADTVEELQRRGGGAAGVTASALNSLPLASVALRRRRPLLGLQLLVVAAAAGSLARTLDPGLPLGSTDVTIPILALLVMSYSLGAYGTGREVAVGVFQPLLMIVVVDLLQPSGHTLSSALPFFAVFIVGAPVLAGRLVRARHAMVLKLREQEREIDAERSARTDAALAVDRLRLAERLHERLVTGMESIALEAAGAQHSLEDGRAEAVATIEARARDLLAETRRVVVSLASPNRPEAMHDEARVDRRPSLRAEIDARSQTVLPWAAIAAAAVCVGLLVEIGRADAVRVPLPVALAGCLLIAVPIAFSWRWPLLMTAALWALVAAFVVLVAPVNATFTAISLSFLPPFAIAYFEPRGRSLLGLAICCLGVLGTFGLDGWAGSFAILLLAWIAGRVLRERTRLVEELRTANMVLTEEREARLRAAVLEERARVARELHDAFGHSLTVIALHAGAARRMWSLDRERAEAALQTIAQVAADGLTELRTGFSSSRVAARNASPETERVHDIHELVQRARGTGLPIRLNIGTPEAALSTETEREAFRVLQEALTNVLKHAPGASAEVTMRTAEGHVEIVVSNSAGTRQPVPAAGIGQGLQGMRERAEACGGRLDWSRLPDGGFEVRAQFPALMVQA